MIILKVKNDKISIFINNIRIYLNYNDIIIIKSDNEAYYNNQRIDISKTSFGYKIYDEGMQMTNSYIYKYLYYIPYNYELLSELEYRDQKLKKLLN